MFLGTFGHALSFEREYTSRFGEERVEKTRHNSPEFSFTSMCNTTYITLQGAKIPLE